MWFDSGARSSPHSDRTLLTDARRCVLPAICFRTQTCGQRAASRPQTRPPKLLFTPVRFLHAVCDIADLICCLCSQHHAVRAARSHVGGAKPIECDMTRTDCHTKTRLVSRKYLLSRRPQNENVGSIYRRLSS